MLAVIYTINPCSRYIKWLNITVIFQTWSKNMTGQSRILWICSNGFLYCTLWGRCTSKLQMLSQISDRISGKETSIYRITIFKIYTICYLSLEMHPFSLNYLHAHIHQSIRNTCKHFSEIQMAKSSIEIFITPLHIKSLSSNSIRMTFVQ